jgi:hypothetical protein
MHAIFPFPHFDPIQRPLTQYTACFDPQTDAFFPFFSRFPAATASEESLFSFILCASLIRVSLCVRFVFGSAFLLPIDGNKKSYALFFFVFFSLLIVFVSGTPIFHR